MKAKNRKKKKKKKKKKKPKKSKKRFTISRYRNHPEKKSHTHQHTKIFKKN